MQTSVWQRFSALYSKEMRELRTEVIIILAAAAMISVTMYFKSGTSARELLIIPIFLLMGLATFLPFISSFKLLGREFSSNTIYFTMSLPARGGMILSSKYLALLSQYLISTLAVGASAFLLLFPHRDEINSFLQTSLGISDGISGLALFLLLFFLQNIVQLSYVIAISFLSQLIGKLVTRFSGLATVGAFLAIFYLGSQVIGLLHEKLLAPISGVDQAKQMGGLPGLFISSDLGVPTQFMTQLNQYLGINILIYAGLTLLLMLLAVYVYNRRIEL